MRYLLLSSVASAASAVAFMSEIVETVVVNVKGHPDGTVRVNKSDFDADQAKDGAGLYSLAKAATADQPGAVTGTTQVPVMEGLKIPPAPSAPAFVNPVAPTTANADTLFVTKVGRGKKLFVVRADGTKVEDMKDIDPDGYDTEELAWAAVHAAKREPALQGQEGMGHTALNAVSAPLSEIPALPPTPPIGG